MTQSRGNSRVFFLVGLALLMLSGACIRTGFYPNGGPCESSDDCPGNQVCVDNFCHQVCNYKQDCEQGEDCVEGACGVFMPVDAALLEGGLGDRQLDSSIAPDAAVTDLAVTDLAVTDQGGSDQAVPDSASSDLLSFDLPPADVNTLDASVADLWVGDLGGADTMISDAAISDAAISDAATSDAALADAAVIDAGGPLLCNSSTLRIGNIFGDGSQIVTYTFDQGFKSLDQLSGSYAAYDAQDLGAVNLGVGHFFNAASFGIGGALGLDALPLPTGASPRAFSMWLALRSGSQERGILSYGDKNGAHGEFFSLLTSVDRELLVDIGLGSFYTGIVLDTDRWYHLAVSYDGSELTIWIDGQFAMSAEMALLTSTVDSHGKRLGDYDGSHSLISQIDQLRIFNRAIDGVEVAQLASECMPADPFTDTSFTNLLYSEDFSQNLTAWNTWGSPLPRLIDEAGVEQGKAFDCNGDANYHSGAESFFSLPYDQNFAVEFRVMQPQDSNVSNKWLYIDVGLTHTLSSGNGTSGLVYCGVSGIRDTNHWEPYNPFGLAFYVAGNAPTFWDNWNDYAYHVYRIEHLFADGTSHFRFFVDGTLFDQMQRVEASTDPWYVTLQGRSYTKDNYVDWVRVYGEESAQ